MAVSRSGIRPSPRPTIPEITSCLGSFISTGDRLTNLLDGRQVRE